LADDVERLLLGDFALALEALLERLALDELEGEVVVLLAPAEVVRSDDVFVLEAHGRDRLALEPLEVMRVPRELEGQDLERRQAVREDVARLVDDPHGALAELLEDLVAVDRAILGRELLLVGARKRALGRVVRRGRGLWRRFGDRLGRGFGDRL